MRTAALSEAAGAVLCARGLVVGQALERGPGDVLAARGQRQLDAAPEARLASDRDPGIGLDLAEETRPSCAVALVERDGDGTGRGIAGPARERPLEDGLAAAVLGLRPGSERHGGRGLRVVGGRGRGRRERHEHRQQEPVAPRGGGGVSHHRRPRET